MALWGRNDNVGAEGTVSLSGLTVTGTGTTFGNVGAAQTGAVIRFGVRDGALSGVFFGDAVVVGIASTTQLTIGSTAGLADAAIANTSFYVSELPLYTVGDHSFSDANTAYDKNVYGITTTSGYASDTGKYRTEGVGWVGVTTYIDCHGELRVKKETLVAAAGIQTGPGGLLYQTNN
jgi:hypothetical protein